MLDAINAAVSSSSLKLTNEQKEEFNFHFARVFERAAAIHGDQMKSAVTRIAVNICRIMNIIALLRSMESLLPDGEKGGKPQENMTRTLMACPGLTPSARIPQENIKNGIVPQFDLAIRNDDFHAVLSLVEPLYRHACMRAISCRSCPQAHLLCSPQPRLPKFCSTAFPCASPATKP